MHFWRSLSTKTPPRISFRIESGALRPPEVPLNHVLGRFFDFQFFSGNFRKIENYIRPESLSIASANKFINMYKKLYSSYASFFDIKTSSNRYTNYDAKQKIYHKKTLPDVELTHEFSEIACEIFFCSQLLPQSWTDYPPPI